MQRCWCAAPKTKYFAETHLNSGGKFGAGHSNKRGWDLISTNKRRLWMLSRNERGSIGVRGESLEFSNLPPCSKARTAAGPRLLFLLSCLFSFNPCHASFRCQQPPPCKCHFQGDVTSGQFLGVFNQIPACVDKLKWPIRLV